ncbi:uncharacterized protein LOC131047709 [Cryptomeria japonica]|uniref:uncharacterized protein LOC131047709 n=1 Tax=Cryptomeria japonica TaxID=3369 RepID=UPI0025AB97A0|nr:uncharacterized protein LOC131047709 [Cryptomeria japonica]
MGICLSSQVSDSTVKLVMEDGRLKEFADPVKVEEILRERQGFFVCHSDSMAFDQYLTPLNAQDVLQLDELYFVLPEIKLKYPLPASEMAAMAIKALSALERSSYKSQSRFRVMPLEKNVMDTHQNHRFLSTDRMEEFCVVGYDSTSVKKYKRSASKGSMASRKAWKTRLTTVPEGFVY